MHHYCCPNDIQCSKPRSDSPRCKILLRYLAEFQKRKRDQRAILAQLRSMDVLPLPLQLRGFHGKKRDGRRQGHGRAGEQTPAPFHLPLASGPMTKCEALVTVCQGSPCRGSGAATRVTAAAMATAVGHRPWRGLLHSSFLAPLAKLREML